jgi:hypothetical protein
VPTAISHVLLSPGLVWITPAFPTHVFSSLNVTKPGQFLYFKDKSVLIAKLFYMLTFANFIYQSALLMYIKYCTVNIFIFHQCH